MKISENISAKDTTSGEQLLEPLQLPSLRPYQQQVIRELYAHIRNGVKRVLLFAPTGAGKCVSPETWVWSKGLKRFGDIWGADNIAGPHTTNTVVGWYDDGIRDGFKVETESGWWIDGTPAHRVWVRTCDGYEGWKQLAQLKTGDFIGLARGRADFGTNVIPLDEAYTLGVLIADGCFDLFKSTYRLQVDKQRPLLESIVPVIERWRRLSVGRSSFGNVKIKDLSFQHSVLTVSAPHRGKAWKKWGRVFERFGKPPD